MEGREASCQSGIVTGLRSRGRGLLRKEVGKRLEEGAGWNIQTQAGK